MKKTLVYGTATAAVVLALGSSITVTKCGRNVETLYGPPPSVQDNDDPVEDLYGPPVAPEADDNSLIEGVYGPPVEYDNTDKPIEDVYGPPVEYDNTDEPIEDVYGPPVELDPYLVVDENDGTQTEAIQPALYGPPVSE